MNKPTLNALKYSPNIKDKVLLKTEDGAMINFDYRKFKIYFNLYFQGNHAKRRKYFIVLKNGKDTYVVNIKKNYPDNYEEVFNDLRLLVKNMKEVE